MKMCLVKGYPGSIEHIRCVLLPKEILFKNDGLFSPTTLPAYSERGQKRAGTEETLGSHFCSPYRSHPHPIRSWQCPRISEKGFHPYEEQNNHGSWTKSAKYPLPSSKQDWQSPTHRHVPGVPRKDAKAKPSFTEKHLGTLVVQLLWHVVPCFPGVLLPRETYAPISYPQGTAGEEAAGPGAGQGGPPCQRPRGARHRAIPPGAAQGAQPVPWCLRCLSGMGCSGC